MYNKLEDLYKGKRYILKHMLVRCIFAVALSIGHIYGAFWLVKERVIISAYKITEIQSECILEVYKGLCIAEANVSFTFYYLKEFLPMVNLAILILLLYTIKIPKVSKGYSRKGKNIMLNLLFQAYMLSGVFAYFVITLFFRHGFNVGNTYNDLAFKYSILYTLTIVGALLIVYTLKRKRKKRNFERVRKLSS